MASNGAQAAFPPEQVLEAMLTMRSNNADRKKSAHKFLEEFQKSVRLWRHILTTLPA
jgi:transportin-3